MSMAEEMNALKAYCKERKQTRACNVVAQLQELKIPAYEQSKNVWRIDTEQGAIMVYPSSSKWVHKNRTFRGSMGELKLYLKKSFNI